MPPRPVGFRALALLVCSLVVGITCGARAQSAPEMDEPLPGLPTTEPPVPTLTTEVEEPADTEAPAEAEGTEAPADTGRAATEPNAAAATTEAQEPNAEPAASGPPPLPATRNELGGFPAIGGNVNFGLLVGVSGSYTRFLPNYKPFRFRTQLTAVAAFQNSDAGFRSPLQNVDLRLDFPGLLAGRLRIYSLIRLQRIENSGYWGIGNGVRGVFPEDYEGRPDRYFTWNKRMLQVQNFARYKVVPTFDLVAGLGMRALSVRPYEDSKLVRDLAQGSPARHLLYGYGEQLEFNLLFGVLFDNRDDEFNPRTGAYHELSVRGGAGPADGDPIYYGSVYLHARRFFSLIGEKLVLAVRGATDVGFGHMPLVELSILGGYTNITGPAGVESNRALPLGRQLGRVKLLMTTELRSTFYRFMVRQQRFALGAAVFTDASRVWAELTRDYGLDGGPLLRFSYGGGVRIIWGSTMIMRFDAGVSPNAGVNEKNVFGYSLGLGQAF